MCLLYIVEFTLAYVVYPEAVSRLPVAPLWSILFFLMLILLAVDSQFLMVETIVIAIMDEFGHIITSERRWMLVLALCAIMYFLGLPMCTQVTFELFIRYSKDAHKTGQVHRLYVLYEVCVKANASISSAL